MPTHAWIHPYALSIFSILALGDAQFPLDPSRSLINKSILLWEDISKWSDAGATEKRRYEGTRSDTGEQHCLSTRRHCYAEAVPLCVLLLCKHRPSDYTWCRSRALPLRDAEWQTHTQLKPSWGSLVEELGLHTHAGGKQCRSHGMIELIVSGLWKALNLFELLKKGGLREAACKKIKSKLKVAVVKLGSIVNHAFDTKRRSYKVG